MVGVERLEELVAAYNAGSIDAEAFFTALKAFVADLDEEETRVAREGLDSSRRSARLVPMVLPLLHGPARRRRRATNQALEGNATPHRADRAEL